jgi:hypothetical protein
VTIFARGALASLRRLSEPLLFHKGPKDTLKRFTAFKECIDDFTVL